MNYKVSVVIPIYGVEKYIKRCAEALFKQTIKEIEFVFVDDCTQDNSITILNDVIKLYPNRKDDIKIVHHEQNRGLPQARKTGISYCTGEYIAHCDSDDWPEVNMYETMYEEAIQTNSDIVVCDYYTSDGTSKSIVRPRRFTNTLMQGPVWNKIVRRSIYNDHDINYPTANKAEDGALMIQLHFFAKQTSYISSTLYNYFSNPDSMCRSLTKDKCISNFRQEQENTNLKINFIRSNGELPKYADDIVLWKSGARAYLNMFILDKEVQKIWRETYPEINTKIIFNRKMPILPKIINVLIILRLYKLATYVLTIKTRIK
jgi:glycosyltransferase involved in cell wall biosynthesis